MIIEIDSLQFRVLVEESKLDSGKTPVVFLHGFTGSANDWEFIFDKLNPKYLPVAIDLIGHGKSSSPNALESYSPLAMANQLYIIFSKLKFNKSILCGYSMGGRAALNFASLFPQKISGLVLESSTKGFFSEEEKSARIKNDFLLAESLKNEGLENFITYWMNIALFDSLMKINEQKLLALKKSKLNNSIIGLSNSLRGFSTGKMDIDLAEFNRLNIPVLLITGELDKKFTDINKSLLNEFSNSRHKIITNAGHNTHVENEIEYISIVNNFLKYFL